MKLEKKCKEKQKEVELKVEENELDFNVALSTHRS